MSFSGGKDSTFTLRVLKEDFSSNELAFTFDNGFLPEQTVQNIRRVTETLGTDHILYKLAFSLLNKIFVECTKQNIYSVEFLCQRDP